MSDIHLAVYRKVRELEFSQWAKKKEIIVDTSMPIITKQDLQKIDIDKNKPFTSTSGSTGEPVFVQKSIDQEIWHRATNIRELLWRKWDVSKSIAIINAGVTKKGKANWNLNPYIFNKSGIAYHHPVTGNLQEWIDEIKPAYLYSYPSIISELNTSFVTDIKSTGERGGTMYSCEEVGSIGIECPNNPDVYHVMENIIVEIDNDNNIIVTDTTHPYLKRYMLGDKGEFATCNCGRGLQTLNKNVIGRVRNMVTYPSGIKSWPKFGTIKIRNIAQNVNRIQAIQTDINSITLKIQGEFNNPTEIIQLAQESLGYPFNITIEKVNEFPGGKFEEFISKL